MSSTPMTGILEALPRNSGSISQGRLAVAAQFKGTAQAIRALRPLPARRARFYTGAPTITTTPRIAAMTYTAPLAEMRFVLDEIADLPTIAALPGCDQAA